MDIIKRNYDKLTQEELYSRAILIVETLNEEPAISTYPGLTVQKTAVTDTAGIFHTDMTKGNAPGAADARKTSRANLVTALNLLADAVEEITPGNRAALGTTNFILSKVPEHDAEPTGMPQDVKVKPTGNPGEAKPSCKAVEHAATYEGRATKDTDSGEYVHCPPSTKIRDLLFTGMETGVKWYFQLRAIGPNGPSPWSDVAVMMVV